MSKIELKAFFKFCRVRVMEQAVNIKSKLVFLKVKPDERYTPVCHNCKGHANSIHS